MPDRPPSPEGAGPDDVQEFRTGLLRLLQWLHAGDPAAEEVTALLREHLGAEGAERSVVTRELPPYEHVNLQAALDSWTRGREVATHGLGLPPHHPAVELQHLLAGEGLPPVRLTAPQLVDLPSGPGRTLACLQYALLLVQDPRGRYAVLVRGPQRHEPPSLAVQVAGLAVDDAQAVHDELAGLRSALNVYRGRVVELAQDQMGGLVPSFVELPETRREEVVLPDAVLRRVERHTLEVARHRDQLRAAGQHLKRGLLLYGPPGTGKTHTTRYVVGQLTGSTVLLLSGRSLHLVGAAAGLARELEPAVVVLEDVDLVAEDRGFGPGPSPVLFELLDAMDGAAADADLLFLLTTNRADLLEPALAARPGRVDVAVEIGLPDTAARRRLLELYGRGVPLALDDADVEAAVARTEGTTASFLKELLRRAVLEALTGTGTLTTVTGEHLSRALDDLLDSGQAVTRALLGVDGADGRAAGGHRALAAPRPGIAPPDVYSSHPQVVWD